MTHVPGGSAPADALAPTSSAEPPAPLSGHAIATIGAWYLLASALIAALVSQVGGLRRTSGLLSEFLRALTFGAAPLSGGVAAIGAVLHVVVLAVGLWCVIAKAKVGVRIAYGIHVALGLYATGIALGLFAGNGVLTSYSTIAEVRFFGGGVIDGLLFDWLAVEVSGIALACAFIVAIFVDTAPRRSNPAPSVGTNLTAILALVFCVGGGLVGVIFGHIALSQIKRTGERGRGLALAATILGYMGLAVWVLWFLFLLALTNAEPR